MTNKIHNHDTYLKFYWIFDHAGIENNKIIDKMTEKIHNFVLSSFERFHHKMTTQVNFIRVSSRKIWDKKWKKNERSSISQADFES